MELNFKHPPFPRYSDAELVERAVRNATYNRRPARHCRWVYVRDAFSVGSGVAKELCFRHGLDPWEMVDGLQEDIEA